MNADLIAAGLAPFSPESVGIRAARLMLSEIETHFAARSSFAFETTLAGRGYLKKIAIWQAAGYHVQLIFLKLASVEEARARIAQRVQQGGHNIPEAVVRRRFDAGLSNFMRYYAPIVDSWVLYDNSYETPVLLNWSEKS